MSTIPFNQSSPVGRELEYVDKAVRDGQTAGNGEFSKRCEALMKDVFSAKRVFLTPSCTAALEMSSVVCNLQPGDEVIMPSYTFVSTANAFVLRGVKPRFVDIRADTKNIDETLIESAITDRTRAIVPVHYAGIGCDMDSIRATASKHGLYVIEDAAQGVNASSQEGYLGTLGHLGAYSFHATKNYSCGEGGALLVNDESMIERAEIIQEKGTNRSRFMRGQVDKYTWVDVGSSYLLSEILAAHLLGQLEELEKINLDRQRIYERYLQLLQPLFEKGLLEFPVLPDTSKTNYHMFYVLTQDQDSRNSLISFLKTKGITATFHYVPLHSSPMGEQLGSAGLSLPVTDRVSACLVRLPMYFELQDEQVDYVAGCISEFFRV